MQSADEMQHGQPEGEKRRVGGSRKGCPNKVSATIKDDVLRAFEEVGRWRYLVRQAEENPRAFMHLLSRCVPQEVAASVGVAPVTFVIKTLENIPVPPNGFPGVLSSPIAEHIYRPPLPAPKTSQ